MSTKPIEKWTTTDFTKYLQAEHLRRYNVEYQPFGKWAVEQGHIGRIIGTKKKAGTHDKAFLKSFIDAAFDEYKPSPQYPGISFGFMLTYKKQLWQRLEAQQQRTVTTKQAVESTDWDEVADWL